MQLSGLNIHPPEVSLAESKPRRPGDSIAERALDFYGTLGRVNSVTPYFEYPSLCSHPVHNEDIAIAEIG